MQHVDDRAPKDVLTATAATRWLALMALVYVLLAGLVAVGSSHLVDVDERVSLWAFGETYGSAALSDWCRWVSDFGAPWVIRLALVAAALVQFWRGHRHLALWLVGVALLENIVAPLAKLVLARPRPEWANPIVVEEGLSFPSGHSAAAGMLITAWTLLILVTVRQKVARSLMVATCLIAGILIAASRIFLGVHYLSDVLAGLILGSILTLAGWLALLRFGGPPIAGDPADRSRHGLSVAAGSPE